MRLRYLWIGLLCAGCTNASDVAAEAAKPAVLAKTPSNVPDELKVRRKGEVETITYPGVLGNMPMDLVRPKPEKSLHRAVILIHGGGWVTGTRKEMSSLADLLAEEGFLALPIEYTLVRQGIWPKQLQDVQAAVRFVRSRAEELDIDPQYIGAAGTSAGGHLSMWLGVSDDPKANVSSRVQAVGSISGIHDLNVPLTAVGDRYRIVEMLVGEQGAPNRQARREASPIDSATKSAAPTLFIHGGADPLVPQNQSDLAAARLKGLGVEAKVHSIETMGHGLDLKKPEERKAVKELVAWLRRHLKVEKK